MKVTFNPDTLLQRSNTSSMDVCVFRGVITVSYAANKLLCTLKMQKYVYEYVRSVTLLLNFNELMIDNI